MMMPPAYMMPLTPREQFERAMAARRGAEASRLRGHRALTASRKRERANRRKGRA